MKAEYTGPVKQENNKSTAGDVAPNYKGIETDISEVNHRNSGKRTKVLNSDGSLPPLPQRDVLGSGAEDGATTE